MDSKQTVTLQDLIALHGNEATIICDSGGGITLQLGPDPDTEYRHCYQNPDQAAEDLVEYLRSGTTDGWEGDESQVLSHEEYDHETERNGGYRYYPTAQWLLEEDQPWGASLIKLRAALARMGFGLPINES